MGRPKGSKNVFSKKRNCIDHEFIPYYRNEDNCDICTKRFYNEHAKMGRIRTMAVVDAYKLSQGCAVCGYAEHPAALEFDHIESLSKLGQTRLVLKGRSQYMKLIHDPNVQVLCANCHRIKTRKNGEYLAKD